MPRYMSPEDYLNSCEQALSDLAELDEDEDFRNLYFD